VTSLWPWVKHLREDRFTFLGTASPKADIVRRFLDAGSHDRSKTRGRGEIVAARGLAGSRPNPRFISWSCRPPGNEWVHRWQSWQGPTVRWSPRHDTLCVNDDRQRRSDRL